MESIVTNFPGDERVVLVSPLNVMCSGCRASKNITVLVLHYVPHMQSILQGNIFLKPECMVGVW